MQKGANAIGQVTYQYGDKTVGYTDILYESTEDLSLSDVEHTAPTDDASHTDAADTDANPTATSRDTDSDLAVTNPNTPAPDQSDSSEKEAKGIDLKPFIIAGIILFLVALGVLYYVLVELPHRRRRSAYFARRKKRREEDSYFNL